MNILNPDTHLIKPHQEDKITNKSNFTQQIKKTNNPFSR